MSENNSADWNWNDYFDKVIDPPMRETVGHALEALGKGDGRQAVDLGCGSGNDTVHMVKAGFKVHAIDGSADGLARLRARPDMQGHKNLTTEQSLYEIVKLPRNVWINAGFALPFSKKDVFERIWEHIYDRLEKGGVFSGQLFGFNDTWHCKVADMNFHDMAGIERLLQKYTTLHLREEESDGTDAVGRPKHWHIYHIVIQK